MTDRTVSHLVVLAAGRGERLRPLTGSVPKPMIEIAGKPLLTHLLERAKSAGIERATLVTGHLPEVIRAYFGDGSALSMDLEYVHQAEQNGTASAIELARESVGAGPFMLSWGDVVVRRDDYAAVAAIFRDRECDAATALNYVEDPAAGAAVYLDADRVTRIVEKPPAGTAGTHWNQGGVFAFTPLLFDYLADVEPSPRGEREFTSALAGMLADGRTVQAYRLPAGRMTLTRAEDLSAAEQWITTNR
jgi:NDP-sugar pyrophosphorylase family protein